ncbi:MAG: hypothetical protein ABH827_03505 [bacterium]
MKKKLVLTIVSLIIVSMGNLFATKYPEYTHKKSIPFQTTKLGKNILCLACTPDENFFAAECDHLNNKINIWDIINQKIVQTISCGNATIHCGAFSPGAQMLAIGGIEGTLTIFDIKRDVILARKKIYSDCWINSITFNSNTKKLATASIYAPVKAFSIDQKGSFFDFGKLYFGPIIASITQIHTQSKNQGRCVTWNPNKEEIILFTQTADTDFADFSPNGKYLVTGNWNGDLAIINTKNNKKIRDIDNPKKNVKCIKFSADSNFLLIGLTDGTILIYKTNDIINFSNAHSHHKDSLSQVDTHNTNNLCLA